ncbi:MAG: hypothetical protein WAT79_13990 [Saprospiraceae bacterium]
MLKILFFVFIVILYSSSLQGTIMNRLELTGQSVLSIDLTSNQAGLYLYELENGIETKLFGKIILVD